MFVFAGVELLGLELLVHSCCNPPQEKDGGDGEVGVVTKSCGSLQGLLCRLQDLLQYLEEVGEVTWSF